MKKLHESIEIILKERNIPLTPTEIAEEINSTGVYERSDGEPLTSSQISARVNQYPSLFSNIHGRIILSYESHWKDLLSSHWYILVTLREILSGFELQFLVSALFFYKRLIDVKFKYGTPSALDKEIYISNYKDFTNITLKRWLYAIENLDSIIKPPMPIFRELAFSIQKMPLNKAFEIIHVLKRIDTGYFNIKEFGSAFEFIIAGNTYENYKHGVIGTPRLIIELMVGILNPTKGTVYNPACGTGSLLVEVVRKCDDKVEVKGLDVNLNISGLAFMNLMMNGVDSPDISAGVFFSNLSNDEKYEYIIGDLPLSGLSNHPGIIDLSYQWRIAPPKTGKKFGTIILFIISKLSHRGKSVVIAPENFLFSGGFEKKVRRLLIEDDLIESVISLPAGGLKPYANGKASILVLNKAKPSYLIKKVKFVDIENTFLTSKRIFFDIKKVINDYQEGYFENKNIQIIDNKYILEEDTLQVTHYIDTFQPATQLLDEKKGVLLGDLVEIKSGINLFDKHDADHLEGVPYIKIENLEKDILGVYLSFQKIENYISKYDKYQKHVANNELLLVARIGDQLKPTYFRPNDDISQIITHTGVLSLIPSHKREFSLEYLYYQLYSSFVQKQIEIKRMGSVMPSISIKALKEVVIPYMPINAQNAFVATQKANIIATEREKTNQRLKEIGFEEEGFEKENYIIRTLVHELRPKLSSIYSFSTYLKRIIDNNEINNLKEYDNIEYEKDNYEDIDPNIDDFIEPRRIFTIEEVCEKIINDSKKLSDILSSVKDVLSFSLKQEDFVETDVFTLLENLFKGKEIEIGSKYSYKIMGSHVKLELHEDSIKLLIDQLLLNAETHAFKRFSIDNKIKFNIKQDKERQIAIIEYSNNGEPFTMTADDYINPFHKSHKSHGSGIGGSLIYRIVKAHKGDVIIKENTTKGFFMTIELPLKQNAYE